MNNQSQEKPKSLGEKLKGLFTIKATAETAAPQSPEEVNPDNLRTGETYTQWGIRICGVVTGNLSALPPFLLKVYNHIYNEQAQNVALQEQAKANTQAEIDQKNQSIALANQKITKSNSDIDDLKNKIEDLKQEQQEIKSGKERVNKDQRIKLIIGLIIIIPLTFYLFLFYSSTFYSAFFRDPASITDVMNSMFDANALANAYNAGLAELGFVLSAPIIFMGLGFALHFFSVQEGKAKYLKMAAILLVTLMFDCILAYKIGEQMHTLGVITGVYPIGQEYTVGMAIHDINTWAVIFCGFIVYVIWGIVFDMCMSAYNKLDLNKTRLDAIKQEISDHEAKIKAEKDNIAALNQQISDERNNVSTLMAKLGHQVYINYSNIRTEMNNFFAGWIQMMKILSLSQAKMDQATAIFNNQMATLIPNNNNN